MIFFSRLQKILQTRALEVFLAAVMTVYGAILAHPSVTLTQTALAPLIDQRSAGLFLFCIGTSRLLCLIVNGAYRPTYHVRTAFCGISAALWVSLMFLFVESLAVGLWTAFFPLAAVFEVWNANRAAADAAVADKTAWVRRNKVRNVPNAG